MKNCFVSMMLMGLLVGSCTQQPEGLNFRVQETYAARVDSVLEMMTLEEKIGQMNQYTSDFQVTGPSKNDSTKLEQIRKGRVGSMLNVKGAAETRRYQQEAMKSRLRIPLLFGLDVIHGMRTVYPIPLAEAASFNLELMERTASSAAKEAASEGIHWTFAPMVDITRDARWGRVMEGAGEDTWYGCKVAEARVRGFQGKSLADTTTILACAKHFAAYGACIGGRDYNTVDVSRLTLHEVYLPPFYAALKAGVATFMNAFNEVDGIPATGNTYLLRKVLKADWKFDGFVVSDWNSVGEMVNHGWVNNLRQAASKGVLAGCDMDMESRAYTSHLEELVKSGVVDEAYIDDAVRRILLKKFELGLFDDPFRYCSEQRQKNTVLSPELKQVAREAGASSIVLLKNENRILPLNNPVRICVIGALADSQEDMLGSWAIEGIREEVVTVLAGIKSRFKNSQVTYAEGYDLNTNKLDLEGVRRAAAPADMVVVGVGERAYQSGEARSMAHIDIPASQQLLVQELKKMGKKVVVLVMGGRPLVFNELEPYADAILMTWWLGTEAGNAIADVLSGDYNPSGKLPMTFPATVGQVPIYYNYKNTGRPCQSGFMTYTCGYLDQDFRPAYPFGYGLSYTQFEISAPVPTKSVYQRGEKIDCKVRVKNIGKYKGKETVQLYIRDLVASVTRPVKELRGFKQIELEPGEQQEVVFTLDEKDLGFYNQNLEFVTEPGDFELMVGNSSDNVRKCMISYEN